jgi:hypothetical protein
MPEQETLKRAKQAKKEGKSASTQAGEFVREEIHHIREGKHGARSAKQAIAIGLSKARRAGIKLKPPPNDSSVKVKKVGKRAVSAKRSRASVQTLRREGTQAASHQALSRQARASSRRRSRAARATSARRAAGHRGH